MDEQNQQIESVNKSTEAYIFKHDWFYVLIYLLVVVALIYVIYADHLPVYLLIIPVFIGILGYSHVQKKIKREFTQQFGASIGFIYSPAADLNTVSGRLFSIGHSQKIYDVLSGTLNGRSSRIFSFEYTVGSGKNSHTYTSTVFETEFTNNMPDITLISKAGGFGMGESLFNTGVERIQLEGDFNKYFTLNVPKGFEEEAYQIFTPDIMAALIDRAKNVNFEFKGSTLYVYSDYQILKRDKLQAMFDLAEYLGGLFQRSSRAVDIGAMTAAAQ